MCALKWIIKTHKEKKKEQNKEVKNKIEKVKKKREIHCFTASSFCVGQEKKKEKTIMLDAVWLGSERERKNGI